MVSDKYKFYNLHNYLSKILIHTPKESIDSDLNKMPLHLLPIGPIHSSCILIDF